MKNLIVPILLLAGATAALASPERGSGRGFGEGFGPGRGYGPGGGPGWPGWSDKAGEGRRHLGGRIAERLGLDEAQREEARGLGEALHQTLAPLRGSLAPLQEALQAALDAPTPDPVEVGRIKIEIHQVHGQMRAAVETFHRDFAAILTPEQLQKWERWQEFRDERRGPRGGHRGPGRG